MNKDIVVESLYCEDDGINLELDVNYNSNLPNHSVFHVNDVQFNTKVSDVDYIEIYGIDMSVLSLDEV